MPKFGLINKIGGLAFMKTLRMTTAQALIKFLNNQYVEFDGKQEKFVQGIFTIFGHGNVLGLGQALEEDAGDLVVHQGRNEQGMVHAAIGFAKQNHRKKIYACTSSVGPGAANMITAAATATANRIPVLLLPGDTYATRQPDPVLQQIEVFHDYTQTTNDGFKAVSRYWDRVNRPEQLMTAMINAMRVLTDPADTGAVTIALPQDVQGEAYDYPSYFFDKRVHRIERRPPSADMIQEAVNQFKSKKKPLLICGGGVRYSEAAKVFQDFCVTFNIPFAETQAGKSAIVWDHELNMGGIGTTGNLAANLVALDADLVIGVGTRFSDFTTASKWQFQNSQVDYLAINVAPFDTYKMDATRITADAKVALEALKEALLKENYKSSYTTEYQEAKKAWMTELQRLFNTNYHDPLFQPEVAGHLDHVLDEFNHSTGSCLTQTEVLGILDELLDDDAIIVGASGSLPGDLQRIWRPKSPNTYHMEYGYSCMGYEISASLGVKLAKPSQEVYAMVGDGSFMMLHSELFTSLQEDAKINVLLFDNMSFGCINNLQMGQGMGSFGTENRYRNTTTGLLDGPLVKVDFAKIGEGYGCKSYTVKTLEELRVAIADAKMHPTSTLIDIKILPKTMTNGYESFWRVGNAEVAEKEKIVETTKTMHQSLKNARQY
jgi:3D-(3,5/4)-trihydroxycyclohexane-1,2-dione acylhydrolase (decyclizing)